MPHSVTPETLPGTQGLPRTEPNVAYDEYLTPAADRPVDGTSTVTAEVAVAAMRTEFWPLDGSGACTYGSRPATVDAKTGVTKLPLRVWPMDSAEVELDIRPEREAASNETVIARVGTGAAFTLVRLKGGREYWVTGPGVLDGAFYTEGTNVMMRLKGCIMRNHAAEPLGKVGINYDLQDGAGLDLPELGEPDDHGRHYIERSGSPTRLTFKKIDWKEVIWKDEQGIGL